MKNKINTKNESTNAWPSGHVHEAHTHVKHADQALRISMKTKTNSEKKPHMTWPLFSQTMKSLLITALFFTGLQFTIQAQEVQYTKPSWWFGVSAGANLNFYRGTTQELNLDLTTPAAFHHGKGVGLYLAPLIEFHRPDTKWGVMFQVGYDNRAGKFDRVLTPCNCPADLSTDLSYITVEPSLRFAPFASNFYLFGGPRIAFGLSQGFTYELGMNPAFPDQEPSPAVDGDFSNMNKVLLSMQIGAGYDISLSSASRQTQTVLSPFIAFHPYFGQPPRSIETWDVSTLRVGVALKFGRGQEIIAAAKADVVLLDPMYSFSIHSPTNIPVERRVRETFPLRNYVFFDLGSTEISDRYVLLRKDQVKDFKEDQLEVFAPKKISGRAVREMTAYYNILNILGDRLGKNPSTSVMLSGSSMEGPEDGLAMAESVKGYLVSVFAINPTRIAVEGRVKPKLPSEQPGATRELVLLREGDRRVTIASASPELLMEFQSGPDAPLKPVEIVGVQQAPLDSYVSFNVGGAKEAFTSWSLEVKDEKNNIQYFGPYTQEKVSIPGKAILGTRPQGDYKVTMVGKAKNGNVVRKETSTHMVLWTPPQNEEGLRYRILYEFNDSKAIEMYDKYLTEVVAPKIPKGATVLIHGYTDIIGDEDGNLNLSEARALDVRRILQKALANAGRSDVKFEAYGFGENENLAQFDNKYPEERFYNRSVVIDIVPAK
jgi:outer membrane protein OmpA-like peptidoglycan-associated protein